MKTKIINLVLLFLLSNSLLYSQEEWYKTIKKNPEWWIVKRDSIQSFYNKIYKDNSFTDPIDITDIINQSKLNINNPKLAFEILLNTEIFASTHVSAAGEASKQAISFNIILNQSNSIDLFNYLIKQANTAGKLYALCGFYFLDKKSFLKYTELFRTRKDSIWTYEGCLMDRQPIKDIVFLDQPNTIRLKTGQTLEGYFNEKYGDDIDYTLISEVYQIDISGGGWPTTLKSLDKNWYQ